MRKILLLTGFVAYLGMGSFCFGQLAYARPIDDQQSHALSAPISLQNAVTCPAMRDMLTSTPLSQPLKNGCADGHCFKAASPGAANVAHANDVIQQGAAIPVQGLDCTTVESGAGTSQTISVIDDPPIPPGVQAVVFRE